MYFFALCQRRVDKYWIVTHLILLLHVPSLFMTSQNGCGHGRVFVVFKRRFIKITTTKNKKKNRTRNRVRNCYVHFIDSIPVDLTLRFNSPLKHLYEYELPGQISGKNTFISRWIPLLSTFSKGIPFFNQDHRNYKRLDVSGGNSFS